jgi:NADH-quinone oxidoreductase subunit K
MDASLLSSNLVLALALFGLGALGFFLKRDAIGMLICVELMLNAVNLAFVTFARQTNDASGVMAALFVIAVAAAEAGVGLSIFIAAFRARGSLRVDGLNSLKE